MKGGKRKGAGRKKGEPTITISVRIPVQHAEGLKDLITTYKSKIKNL